MDDQGRIPPKETSKKGTGGVRAPLPGESSSSDIKIPQAPSDSPTIIGTPGGLKNDRPKYTGNVPPQPRSPLPPTGPTRQSAQTVVSFTETGQVILEAGVVLAQRYEIVSILGEGGMGAVYKAKDLELNRLVALKVIRRELAGNQAIIDRFKQELILATQVTHKNVIRIYDLGESDSMKFITMEFVEGEDLRSLITTRKKLPPREAVEIIQQACRALEAAHSVGVIHRDLKPQNIMQDKSGRILVMDFGLARTLEGDGMTQSGALVGTMEYMSPEQALAKNLDQRSDIFSLGLIFYELLTGQVPFRADSALASLIKRTQERVVPISELDATVPAALSEMVSRCLEREVDDRYQSISDLLADLETWKNEGSAGAPVYQSSVYRPSKKKKTFTGKDYLLGGVAALAVMAFVLAGYFGMRSKLPKSESIAKQQAAIVPAVSLAILPFHNMTDNAKDDWIGNSVADMLSTDVGQSAHLRTVSTDRLHQVLSDLRIGPQTSIDPDTIRRVAEFSNADVVVSGQYARFGDQIVIDATIRDLKRDQTVPVKAQALEKDLPTAIDSLADAVRKNLSLSQDIINELKAQSFKATSKSVDALREYNEGLTFMREGKNLDAYKSFQAATAADPDFALALSRQGEVQSELGFETDSEQSSRRAKDLAESQNLPLPVKYLISASHARIMDDKPKAIEAYENLARSVPGDSDVQYTLGSLYLESGDYAKARSVFAKILETDPKNIKALWGMGVVENIAGSPQAALDALSKGLSLAIQVDNQEQKALMLLSMGISYRLLNKPDEAMRNYQDSIAINEKIGQKRGVAAALDEMANFQAMNGKSDAALASYKKALALQREIGMKKETANSLMDMGTVYQDRGDYDQALDMYKQALQIQREQGDQQNESLCLNNIAAVYLTKGDPDNAFTFYQQALQLRQKLGVAGTIAETMGGLGEAYVSTGQYEQALKSLMGALELSRKSGDPMRAAIVSHEIGLVFEYQGRFGAAVKSMQDAVSAFREQGEHGRDMASFQNDLAGALARAGRGDESAKPLEEAEAIARQLKNDALMAIIMNTRGDVVFYKGDYPAANQMYQNALKLAQRTKDPDALLLSKLNVARVAIAQGRSKEAIAMLRPLTAQAGKAGANIEIRISIALAQAEVGTKDYVQAERDLELTLTRTEKAGMRLDSAQIYYLLATSVRLRQGEAQAKNPYREALRLLNLVRYDPGAENILKRADVKVMYDEAVHYAGETSGSN
jgi:eukaryotic-like serine/threonine-protein kinase